MEDPHNKRKTNVFANCIYVNFSVYGNTFFFHQSTSSYLVIISEIFDLQLNTTDNSFDILNGNVLMVQ